MAPCARDGRCKHGVEHRHVYLPLEKLDKCVVCGSTKGKGEHHKLTLCSACGERIYCSTACQKTDWSEHKQHCGGDQNERIDIAMFYPFLAFLAEVFSLKKPPHFANNSPIVNDVNPTTSEPVKLPDGWEAKLVVVNDTKAWRDHDDLDSGHPKDWWPMAESVPVAMKLMYRIMREGYVLPSLTAIALAILAEVYTTTTGAGSTARRIRFRYWSSPIADFGIARGSALVKPEGRLAYMKMSDKSIVRGQDPDDHYWMYFTTIREEEVVLDFAMFTFNMCMMIPTKMYVSPTENMLAQYAPAFFGDRSMRKGAPSLYNERSRVSVLRNPALHDAIRHTHDTLYTYEVPLIHKFMEDFAGRAMTEVEKDLTCQFAMEHCHAFNQNIVQDRRYKSYPTVVPQVIQSDPGELNDLDDYPLPNWKGTKKPRTMRR
ncbi:hypothetical protein PHLGIDRAFT_355206 [Phlebiopsis gigantea 11061_1 CR5-6]|uniref:MYND-type domain-containing protein n=1 Tax=Phlebiopsis gigantea (strain 11061_1 CR5-6) TaxID=745531 RepID=A0A0C3PPP8_PHLG1|nr:hypothetical protein PHLGIDRAFT_355206 [Phlebiopsis gigantea 11061_1 CR5-6]